MLKLLNVTSKMLKDILKLKMLCNVFLKPNDIILYLSILHNLPTTNNFIGISVQLSSVIKSVIFLHLRFPLFIAIYKIIFLKALYKYLTNKL